MLVHYVIEGEKYYRSDLVDPASMLLILTNEGGWFQVERAGTDLFVTPVKEKTELRGKKTHVTYVPLAKSTLVEGGIE